MKVMSLILVLCLIVTAGCGAHISKEAKHKLKKPIDCRTAEYDIEILEGARASASKQAMAGAQTITPAGIATGILGGTWNTNRKVATGEYNKAIDDKIREIKDYCRIR